MRTFQPPKNNEFIGREREKSRLSRIQELDTAQIIVVHGRRRVGKTELLEQFFRERNVLKFEGIEGASDEKQRDVFAGQLINYAGYKSEILNAKSSWITLLTELAKVTSNGQWTIYFEELQWLAGYKEDFIAELKYVWDNYFRHNSQIILILCGSSPSFMKKKVIKSRSLYSRSMHTISLAPFSLKETKDYLGDEVSLSSILDTYLAVGGIPEYLNYFKGRKSFEVAMAKESFTSGGFFIDECERIFVSSLADKEIYRKIVNFLASKRYASRIEIAEGLNISSGGTFTEELEALEESGLIEQYSPYNSSSASKMVRYCLRDNFLQFYFKFIHPEIGDIRNGIHDENPTKLIKHNLLRQWLGYALERHCRYNHNLFASFLGFGGIEYKAGAYFRREHMNRNRGYQIDLLFDRKDKVITVCEIKYLAQKVGAGVVDDVAEKLTELKKSKTKSIERVLIAPNGIAQAVQDRLYFDKVIEIEDIFNM